MNRQATPLRSVLPPLLVALCASTAFSQSARLDGPIGDVDPRIYDPAAGPGALIGLDTTWIAGHLDVYGALTLNVANDELVARQPDGEPVGPLRLRFITTLGLGLGLFDALDLQVALPLHTTEEFVSNRETAVGLGDVAVTLRWRALGADGGLGLAIQAGLWLPTGGSVAHSTDGGVVFEPRIVADYRFGSGAVLAAHIGFRLRPAERVLNLAFDDELRFGVGGELPMATLGAHVPVSLIGELEGALGLGSATFDPDDGFTTRKTPLEARMGLRVHAGDWAITAAGGFGLTDGYGTPDYRGVIKIGWSASSPPVPEPPPRPTDVVSATTTTGPAPTFPPAPAFPAPAPARTTQPTGEGPTPDALTDAPTDAPDALAAFDGAVASDPDPDNDGVAGTLDRCPAVAEDADGYLDQDGCPDPDNDGDGVLDAADRCPTTLETPNGLEDDDGCPDAGEATVVAKDGVIELSQTIEFNSGSNVLAPTAAALLDQIASVLKANPHVRRVRVEGHTDNEGDEEMNVDLSERRAERIRFELVKRGVDRDRMLPRGFGSTRPVAPNTSTAGRKKNRRVEFRVIDPPPPGAPRIDFDSRVPSTPVFIASTPEATP